MQGAQSIHRLVLALCILHVMVTGCARTRPVTATALPLSPVQRLRADVLEATRMAGVRRGLWGIAVESLDRGDRLIEVNAAALMVPASAAKLVSVATAVDAVGWDFRFETAVRTNGRVSQGVLHGDLVVVGSGDPTLGGRAGDDVAVLVNAVRALGIRRIDGRVIGDDDAMEEPRPALAWAWDDLGYSTGAIFGALNLAENRMTVTVTPGGTAGAPTSLTVEPVAAYRPLGNRSTTGAPGSPQLLWPEQRPAEPFLTIAGSIPAGAPPARLVVSAGNPTFWFASVLRQRLLTAGVEVTGEAFDADDVPPLDPPAATVLASHRSRPLAAIARALLKDSINLYAEAVMRLNAGPGVFPTNDAALAGVRRRLETWGLDADAQQLVDGSGLSRRNTITPGALLRVLRRMFDGNEASPWMDALPVAGVDGSLATRLTDAPAAGNVRAKTGAMTNVRSLAGYVTTREGERLAFVILVNNFEGSGAQANQAIDAIAAHLAAFSRG